MRKIIGLLLLLGISIAGYAQSYQPISTYGYQWKRGKFDVALLLPQGTGSTLPSDSVRDGAIRYNPSTSSLQIWVSGAWGNITAGGSIRALDSARLSNDTLYFRYKTGGELAVKLNDIRTASHGLTKTGNDVALGGTFGSDGNDITILGKNYSGLYLQGTSGTDYNSDLATTQLRVFGGAIQMQAIDRTAGNLSQHSFSTSGITTNSTKPISLLSYNGGPNNKLLLSPDSVNIYGGVIKFSGPLQAYNLRNNSAGDSVLYTDSLGRIKQKFVITTGVDSNYVKSVMNVDTVATIAAMQSYSGRANVLVVKDTLRGGVFMSKGSGIVDNGITFTGAAGYWTRVGVNNNAANVLWYGAIPNDGVADNTAFAAAIATGKSVYVPDGKFLITTNVVVLKDGQMIYGNGPTSILYTTVLSQIRLVDMGNNCIVRDLMFLGTNSISPTNPYSTTAGSQIGVRLTAKNKGLVSNCYFKLIGAGFYVDNIVGNLHEGSTVIGCKADSCFNGFYSGTRGEYINYIGCHAYGCTYGLHIIAGNNTFASGSLTNNQVGVWIKSDRGNDAHGKVVGSEINHNVDHAIIVDSTLNSFLFSDNMIYFSNIYLKDVINGVRFINNDISSVDSIKVRNCTNIQFINNAIISTKPQMLKNWNGVDNTGTLSDVTMFNSAYPNITSYADITQPQNQLRNGLNVSGSGNFSNGHVSADSGLIVKRTFTSSDQNILNAQDSVTSGGIKLINGTLASGQFVPTMIGDVRYDSLGTSTYRNLYLQSKSYNSDTTGKTLSQQHVAMSSGGLLAVSINLNQPVTNKVLPSTSLFQVGRTLSPTNIKIGYRMGGDFNAQLAGKFAIGYPFAVNDLTDDNLPQFVKVFPSGRGLMVNGTASGGVAVSDSDFVVKKQLDSLRTGTVLNNVPQNANFILSGPTTGTAANPTFRSLVAADIPNIDVSKITTGTLPIARGGTGLTSLGSSLQQLRVNAGGSALEYFTPTVPAQLAGAVKDFYADATSADSLYPYTIPSSYLANNGDKIKFTYAGTFSSVATSHIVGLAIAGTSVASMSNGATLGGNWKIEGYVIRVSNTVVRYTANLFFDNSGVTTNATLNSVGELTGLNLSGNGLRVVVTAGTPNSNVTANIGSLIYISAAP